MTRLRAVAFTVALLATIGAAAGAPCANRPAKDEGPTRVIRFEPEIPAGAARKGYCWTGSIADPRPGAWRCMAGNEIHDPCFSVAGDAGVVVCGADPFRRQAPFVLKLTRPLKVESPPAHKTTPSPWLVELADGTRCGRMTGTLAVVAHEPVPYACWKPSRKGATDKGPEVGLLDDFRAGREWTVTRVVFTLVPKASPPFKLLGRKRVAIKTVWW